MRLLRATSGDDFELVTYTTEDPPPYAILSHTWAEGEEVTYDELLAGTGKAKAGYDKIRFCGERAAHDGLQYFWVDTCCINKATNDELSTAINSMFRWYQRASRCYVYLSDVQVPEEVVDVQASRTTWEHAFRRSRWFTRGWTLQELLAPPMVVFFSRERRRLGSKMSLAPEIHEITKIPIEAIRGQRLSEFGVEERMVWAEKRRTLLEEDRVYCLLGIFGVFLPLIYGEGEEHAFLRLNEEVQKRREGRGTETPRNLSASLLPFPRNESFVGRSDQLQSLEKLLLAPITHRRLTVCGLGGCGKSALALELAYRAIARNASYLVLWVPAMSRESFELAYREIGVSLRVPGITDGNADVKQLVKKELSSGSSGDWLMIVDNADDPRVLLGGTDADRNLSPLSDYLPRSNRGTILFTTRSRKAAETLTPGNVIKLDDMNRIEAGQLIAQRLSAKALLEDKGAVDELLELLAYLPLAIVQAAAFINSNGLSISEYTSLFRQPSAEVQLFSEHFEDPSRYREAESTIAKTWHISFDQILQQDPLAADYLSFMACIDRLNIPQSLLPLGNSPLQQAKAIGTLKGYAFITERQQVSHQPRGEKFFDIHRLVHMASMWWLKEHCEWTVWASGAADRLEEVVPYGGHEKKEAWMTYLPHAIHVAGLDGVVDEARRASLFERVGQCQKSLGQYSTAETTLRQALLLREKALGNEHIDTLRIMNAVGLVLEGQGKYEAAEAMHRETVAILQKVLGKEHPDTLASMHNLAQVLHSQGKYEAAEEMYRETLATKEKELGKEHPSTLTSMNNLARVLDSQGKYEAAEAMYRETLATKEKVLGKDHPETLISVYSLARLLSQENLYHEAVILYQRACTGFTTSLGYNHPTTRACHQDHSEMLHARGSEQSLMPRQLLRTCGEDSPRINANSTLSAQKGKRSRLSRGLAKMNMSRLSKPPT